MASTEGQEPIESGGSCEYAGSGRGDCDHWIGLPGDSIPNQHDGDDDTVDHYGKPNGWCWQCWKTHTIEALNSAIVKALGHLDHVTPQRRNGAHYQAADVLRAELGLVPMTIGGHATEGLRLTVHSPDEHSATGDGP